MVTPETIEHLARLALVHLSDEEKNELANYINKLLPGFQQLSEVDTSGVEPLVNVMDGFIPLRPDEVKPSLDLDKALANAPDLFGSFFKVPPMIGDDDE